MESLGKLGLGDLTQGMRRFSMSTMTESRLSGRNSTLLK